MIDHVLLDFDRTLHDSDAVHERNLDGFLGLTGREVLRQWAAIHREVLAKHPKERHGDEELHLHLMIRRWKRLKPWKVLMRPGLSLRLMLARRKQPDAGSLKQDLKARVKAAQEECWRATTLFDEAIPFLNHLKEAGYRLHIATGDYAQQKAEGIERYGGRKYFDWAFDESVLGVGKGKREYFDRLLERLQAPAGGVAIVGDSLVNDVGPAKEAGIATVWIRRRNEKSSASIVPDLVFPSLTEALGYFRRNGRAQ